ncbi:MAG: TraB/VirB10 family protein [Planctomycetaceae bacterium]|nr:TraB/VirB10 family protein [Planctomycetaceae bacterium]
MDNHFPKLEKPQKARLFRMVLVALGAIGGLVLLGRTCGPTGAMPEGGKPPNSGPEAITAAGTSRTLGFDEVSIGQEYRTSVASQSHRLSQVEQDMTSLRQNLEMLKGELVKASGSQEAQLARLDELSRLLQGMTISRPAPEASEQAQKPGEKGPGVHLVTFEPAAPRATRKKVLRIPAGSAAEGRVLNGCFAPTGGEPSPLRLKLDAAIIGPSESRIPLRGAVLVGKAQGDANATRVHVELISLSTVKPSGQSVEVPVRGYVVGEDGMEGIPGTYLYRLDDQLPLVVATEGAAGFANALAQNQTSTFLSPLGGATSAVTGDALKFAGLKAAAGTSSKVGDIVAERMKEIHPAVWTAAERPVKAVFLEGVSLDGFDPLEVKDDEAVPFRDLDPRR